jgi:hypothetical protein
VAKLTERLAMNKQTPHRVHMERFSLKKLNDVKRNEQYRAENSNKLATSKT